MPVTREYRSIDEARSALAGRLDRARTPCLFDRLEWYAALHADCLADRPPRIFQVAEGASEAWMFLTQQPGRRLSALANWYSFAWRPIFLGAPDATAQDRLLEIMARGLARDCAQIDFYPVALPATLSAPFRRAGWFAVQRPLGGRHLLHLNGRDFAAYWASRPGRLRNIVRRKDKGQRLDISISNRMTDALWRDYEDVHARSWKEPEPGLDFLRGLAAREGAAGSLRLGFARLDGRAVATQLWTVENGVALIHKLSHDRAHDDRSPGTLLSHAMFRQAIDVDQVATIDYGTGDNPYKTDWMETRQTLHRVDCFNPRFASSWIPAARTAISALVG